MGEVASTPVSSFDIVRLAPSASSIRTSSMARSLTATPVPISKSSRSAWIARSEVTRTCYGPDVPRDTVLVSSRNCTRA